MPSEKEFATAVAYLGGDLYAVGGCVRDSLLGRDAVDRDYVVCGLSEKVFHENFNAKSVGKSFPVFLTEIDGQSCEVSLARTEVKIRRGYCGFHVRFDPSVKIEDDLFRRDTTMNSIARHVLSGKIVDPFGGRGDIAAHRIRATSEHFCDDPVRALRAARQAAQLDFNVEPATLELMGKCCEELADEPSERIFCETEKALASPRPEKFFITLRDAGLLDTVFPELAALVGVEQPIEYHFGLDAFDHTMEVLQRTAEVTSQPATRFAALMHDIGKGATPRELWPHHYGHDKAGLPLLDVLNRRMTLPRRWYALAKFIIDQHMRIPSVKKISSIIELVDMISRLGLQPSEISAVISADGGSVPDFLTRYVHYRELLKRARAANPIPKEILPEKRRDWLRSRVSGELKNMLLNEQTKNKP